MVSILDLQLSAPILILTLGSLLVLLSEVTFKSEFLRTGLTAASLVGSFAALLYYSDLFLLGMDPFGGFLFGDKFSWLSSLLLIGGATLTFFLGFRGLDTEKITSQGEYYALFLMSLVGALVLVTARELILLFVGLEIMSIALYALCSLNLWSSRSSESGLKYFLLGSMSSAVFLYGIALLYGLSGSLVIPEIAGWVMTADQSAAPMLWVALGFILVGFAFKIGFVPFHFWIPDVYQGAPTVVTAYMACVIKSAAVLVTIRALWIMFGDVAVFAQWSDMLWVLAVLTMTFGNLIALRQRSLKRMLAYSSIAHAGYMAIALLVPGSGGGAALIYYLAAYMLMTFGAFAVVMIVSESAKDGEEGDAILRFNGIGLRYPALGVLMTIFIFALAGLPPGLSGFLGKFYIFNAAIKGDYTGLVIVAVINSAISCYYYLRVLVAMYFNEGQPTLIKVRTPVFAVMCLCAIAVVLLGMFPAGLHELGATATELIYTPVGLVTK